MKKRKKIFAMLGLVSLMTFAFAGNVFAATSDNWSVDYQKGAPTTAANPVDYLYVTYSSDGFLGTCKTISGSADRMVTVTATNAGGINNTKKAVYFTTNKSQTWKTVNSVSTNVTHKVVASASNECSSTGTITRR